MPRRPSPALRHGVEVHRRIELHHRGAVAFEEADEAFYDAPDDGPAQPGAFANFQASRFADDRPILVEAPFELRCRVLALQQSGGAGAWTAAVGLELALVERASEQIVFAKPKRWRAVKI